jgi:hypothetical protein
MIPDYEESQLIINNAVGKIKTILNVINMRECNIESTDEPLITIQEVYQNISVLNEQVRKLQFYKNKLDTIKYSAILSDYNDVLQNNYEVINTNIIKAQNSIDQWKNIQYIGELSTETSIVYSGFRGIAWYDRPLRMFLHDTVGKVFVVRGKSILVNDMRSLLHILNTLYDGIDYITLDEERDFQVPKSPLIGIIQQLMLIELTPPDTEHEFSVTLRSARKARRDRAMFKISNDFQISITTIEGVFREYDLLNYNARQIMDSCGIEIMKSPPKWVKNIIGEPLKNTTTKPQVKEYTSIVNKIKKQFLRELYGKYASMSDNNQEAIFQTNLNKYNNGEFTRLSKMDMGGYDKYHNIISSQIN